jgi:hypothetical protein
VLATGGMWRPGRPLPKLPAKGAAAWLATLHEAEDVSNSIDYHPLWHMAHLMVLGLMEGSNISG